MINHEKLKPWILYPKRSLAEIVKGRDKFSGIYLALISTSEIFFKDVFGSVTFRYLTKFIRAYYAERVVQLSFIPGTTGLKVTRNQNAIYKMAKTTKPINFTSAQLLAYKGKSFVYPFAYELNRCLSYNNNDFIKKTNIFRTFLNYCCDHLFSNEKIKQLYSQSVMIINIDDPKFGEFVSYFLKLGKTMDKGLPGWKPLTFFWSPRTDILVKADFEPGENVQKMIRVLPLLLKISIKGQAALEDAEMKELMDISMELEEIEGELEVQQEMSDNEKTSLIPESSKKNISKDELRSVVIEQMLIDSGISPARREPLSKVAYEEIIKQIEEMPDNVDPLDAVKEITKNPVVSSELKSTQQFEKQKKQFLQKASELEEKQNSVIVKDNGRDIPISELFDKNSSQPLEIFVTPDTSIAYPEIRTSTIRAQSSEYTKKVLRSDIVETIRGLNNDEENPLFIKSLEITDASNSFNKFEQWKIELTDPSGRTFLLKPFIPKISDEGYMYFGGSKKFLAKQYVALPVFKKKPDEVQVTGNYNKTFINRRGTKLNSETERIKKFLMTNRIAGVKIYLGNVHTLNGRKITSLVFSDWSQQFMSIDMGDLIVDFDIHRSEDYCKEKDEKSFFAWSEKFPKGTIIARKQDGSFYFYPNLPGSAENLLCSWEISTNKVRQLGEMDVNKFILWSLKEKEPALQKKLSEVSVGRQFAYNIIRILRRKIPLVILLSYKDGFEPLMKRYGIQYEFAFNRRSLDDESKLSLNVIPFKDGFLYYKNSKLEHCLLMHGMSVMDTQQYSFAEMNQTLPYLDYFETAFNSRNISKGFKNFYDRFIERNMAKLLEDLKLPTDFTGLMLHCNTLLKDNTSYAAIDPRQYRIRSTEIIAQALYQELSTAFNSYKTEVATNRRAAPLSVREDGVIKRLSESQNLESLSLLSPIIELEAQDKCTFKGIGGINLDDSFTSDYRYYMKDMQGIFGYYSPISSQCGITRALTYNAAIKDTRGLLEVNGKEKTATESLTILELLNPFSATSSDFPRIAMLSTQNKHCTPTVRQTKPLVCSGMQKVIPHIIGQDFVFKAKTSGSVEKIDNKNQVIILKYTDGSTGLIDIKPKLVKNVKSGFYIEVSLKHELKQGQKFSEKEILAYDPNFFQKSTEISGSKDSLEYTNGCLGKTALLSHSSTFEDSMVIGKKISKDLGFYITSEKFVALGKNSHVSEIVKIGDEIKASDSLIVFENSFDQAEVNEVLKKLGSDDGEAILEIGKNSMSAKTSGRIVDIRVYYNRPFEELSESLQKIVSSSITGSEARSKILDRSKSDDIIEVSSTEQLKYDTIYGQTFDGVLIQFFISHLDECGQGDKLAAQVALKGVISTVLEEDEQPRDESDEPIDLVLTPLSFTNRMTSDFHKNLYTNKILVELKKKVGKILNM